jgi:O-antigen/teichoic acid export membrane protein
MLALPRAMYVSLVCGRQQMGLSNGVDIGAGAIQQLGTAILLALGASLAGLVWWIAVANVLWIAAYMVASAHLFGWRAMLPGISTAVVRRNLRFSAHMASISLLSVAHSQAHRVAVSKLLPLADFGHYSFASTLAFRATLLNGAVAQAAFPALSALFGERNHTRLQAQYRKLQDLLCFGILPVFPAIIFMAIPLYTYVFDAAIARQLLAPTALLCLGFYMNGTLNIPYILSLAAGRPDIVNRANLQTLLIMLPTTFVLVWRLGLVGASLSWVVYHLFAYVYMVPRLCRDCLHTSPIAWYVHVARALGLGTLTYGVVFLAINRDASASLPALALGYAGASAVYLLGSYRYIGNDLRLTARDTLRGLRLSLQRRPL